jgi:iron complex outermembrane recepter protein
MAVVRQSDTLPLFRMNSARRLLLSSLLCLPFTGHFVRAQPNSEPVVRAETVVVEDTPLVADSVGGSYVRFDDTTPTSSLSFTTFAAQVANLHVNAGGAGAFGDVVSLRGLANTPYFSDPSVAVYFDDLPLGNAFTFPTELFGFTSATISRGPQATALGRGGEGGAIVFNSTEPSTPVAGEFRGGIGNFNSRTAAFVTRTRSARTDASVAGSLHERDGYISNTLLGQRVDDVKSYAGSARFRFRPTASSELSLQLLGSRHRDGAQPLVPLGGPLFAVSRGREGSTHSDFDGAAFKAVVAIPIGSLSSVTSHTEWTLNPYDNRLTLPPTIDSKLTQAQRVWNEELRLSSNAQSAVMWHAGTWFSDGETHGDANRVIPGLFPIEASHFVLHTRTSALLAEATVPPNIGWSITAGLRVEETKKHFDRSQRVPGPGQFTAAKTFEAVLPKLSVSYAFTNDTTASATVAMGTKPGGWSAYTGNTNLAGFKAEKATTFEAGVETSLANKAVKIAARVFNYEIRDYQIERSFNATDYLVVNASRARSVGAEIEASWHPMTGLVFTATGGLTDVTLREFTDPFTSRNYAGRRAPYTPDYDAHLGVSYRSTRGWFAATEVAATGKTFYDESENPTFASRAHATVNARIGYETRRWRTTLSSENLGDTHYTTLIVPGVRHEVPGAPRTYGVEVAVKW